MAENLKLQTAVTGVDGTAIFYIIKDPDGAGEADGKITVSQFYSDTEGLININNLLNAGALAAKNTVGTADVDNDAITLDLLAHQTEGLLGNTAGGTAAMTINTASSLRTWLDVYTTGEADAAFQPLAAPLTTLSTAFSPADATGAASLAFAEDTDNGVNTVSIAGPAAAGSNKTQTLQDVTGTILVTGGQDVAVADGGTGASTAGDARTNLGLVIGTDVQAYAANLDTWAGVTPSVNGQSLVSAANYAAMRALLDLEAGTDFYSITAADAAFEAKDADLTAIAGLTTAANKMIRYTGSGTADLIDFLDEDLMTSNSATAVASQQSIKAYVDAEIAKKDDLVEDLTPQLGGDLDTNDFNISFFDNHGLLDANSNEAILIQTVASAVNYLSLSPAATGTDITLDAVGDDVNVGLNITSKGSGAVKVNGSRILTVADEGSGNGIDADTLDGVEGANYARLSTAQTLTNKTIDGDNNTLSNLDIGNEVDWAAAADVTDRTAFASGDKLIIFEAGVGLRKIDFDDLPGAGGGLSNIVEDTTPQLGGMLDVNGNALGDGTLELLAFTETVSAVNHLNITNAATGNAPVLSAVGDDANIDLALAGKGTGNVTIGGSRILTVADEGTGNGLDADTLDGQQASAFQTQGDVLDDLNTLGAAASDGQIIVATGPGAFAYESGATLRTSIGVAIGSDVQAWDADLDAIAALATTAAGRSVLTIADPNADRMIAWDDTAGAMAAIALADITTEGAPATGDFLLAYTAEGALVKINWSSLPSGGASQLSDLSDVNTSTPTNRNVLVADGVDWESRALVEADISDLGSYLTDIVLDTTPQLGGALDGQGNDLNNVGVIFLTEQAAAEVDVAGKGQVWVQTATPNLLMFTDDAGTDFQIATLTGTETLTNKTIDGDNNTISNLDIGNEVDWAVATDVADRSATPASGDKLLIFEAGVGLRKIDWDDLPSGGGGSGTLTTIKANGVQVGGADIVTLDFSDEFSVSESPDTEVNVSLAAAQAPGKTLIPILAQALIPSETNGPASATVESGAADLMITYLDFDDATDEYAQIMIPMPKGWNEGTVTARFRWASTTTSSGNCVWGAQASAISDHDTLSLASWGTAQTVTDGVNAQSDLNVSAETSAVTIGGTPAEGDLVAFRFYRDANNASDTLVGDARLIAVDLFVTMDAANDA